MKMSTATLKKEFIYEVYNKTVEEPKEYEGITRKKMIHEIFAYYQKENFLEQCLSYQDILDLKEIIKNDNCTVIKLNHLYELLLLEYIDYDNFCINEAILPFIKEHINSYDLEEAKKRDEKNNIIIGMIKGYGVLSIHNFEQFVNIYNDLHDIELDFDKDVLSNRIAREYYIYENGPYSEMIVYKAFWQYAEELIEIQAEGEMDTKFFDYDSLLNIAKYDLDVSVKSLKNFNEKVSCFDDFTKKRLIHELMIMLNLGYEFKDIKGFFTEDWSISSVLSPDLLKLMRKAIKDIPMAIHNGFTMNEMKNKEKENAEVSEILKSVKQSTACLGQKEASQFYKMYMRILDFVNLKYNVVNERNFAKAYHVDPANQVLIREKLFDDLSIIDEYISINPDRLNNYALRQVRDIKHAILIECFVVKYERNYTLILSKNEELYGVIGGVCNMDEIIPADTLPHMCTLALIPYKGKIIYDGVIQSNSMSFGSGFKKNVIKSIEEGVIQKTLVKNLMN